MHVAVIFTQGFEEIEGFTIIDILRRAEIPTDIIGTTKEEIRGAHNITIIPDKPLQEITSESYDAIILPGGSPGYQNLADNDQLISIIKEMHTQKKTLGAICAAPYVLAKAGILKGKQATIYPGMEEEIKKGNGIYVDDLVVTDNKIITSKGPATSMLFALTLVELFTDTTTKERVAKKLLIHRI